MEQKNSNKRKKKAWLNVLIGLCAAGMVFCAVMFLLPLIEYNTGDKLYADLAAISVQSTAAPSQYTPQPDATPAPTPLFQPNFEALSAINDDIAGWFISEGTVIHYPVVKGKDNSYYLTHLFDGSRNRMGTLFIDCDNAPDFADSNTIIYGHHMKSGAMFASLVGYREQTYYNVYPTMVLLTPHGNYRVELFAGYTTGAASETYQKTFDSADAFAEYLATVRAKSDFKSDVDVTPEDHIVTLSTCTYEYDNARYVVQGKLVALDD